MARQPKDFYEVTTIKPTIELLDEDGNPVGEVYDKTYFNVTVLSDGVWAVQLLSIGQLYEGETAVRVKVTREDGTVQCLAKLNAPMTGPAAETVTVTLRMGISRSVYEAMGVEF